MQIQILPAPTPAFEALVDRHVTFCDGTAPAESCHRLPVSALFTPEITMWTVSDGDTLLGMGAMKALSELGRSEAGDVKHGEIKSMHTTAEARGKGVAKQILKTIIAEAKARNYEALWLETGVHPDFRPARALYAAHGFTECPPFGDYILDPHSVFMTLDLSKEEATQ
jgi:putative acetyltransferase